MEDRDYYGLAAMIVLLAVCSVLQARILKRQDEMLVRHDEDITFLRLVARETEKRLADD